MPLITYQPATITSIPAQQRLTWIDYAKGAGIILVVYGHVVRGLDASKIVSKAYYNYSDNFVYSFHMPLFFILSGYFFYHSFNKKAETFLNSKIRTLLYPFILWSLLQTTVEVLLSNYTNNKIPPQALLDCLIIPRAQFWFLFSLFIINILNFIIFKLNSKFGILLSFLAWWSYYILQPDLGPFEFAFRFLLFFNVGIFFSEMKGLFLRGLESNIFLLLNISAFCLLEYLFLSGYPKVAGIYDILLPLSGSMVVMQLSERAARKNIFRFLEDLGKASLAIYLAHILVASGCRIILFKALKMDDPILHILTGTISGIIIPMVVFTISKRTSSLSWLFYYPNWRTKINSPELNG